MSAARTAAFVLVVLALQAWHPVDLEAQQSSDSLRIAVAGGFLGKLEGFPDRPGSELDVVAPPCPDPPARCHLGGVLALRDWLQGDPDRASRWLFLTANNRPHPISRFYAQGVSGDARQLEQHVRQHVAAFYRSPVAPGPFWPTVQGLRPKVIAIGQDDILRSLWSLGERFGDTPRETGEAFLDWLTSARPYPDAPLLLSNGVLRVTGGPTVTGQVPEDAFTEKGGRPLVEWNAGAAKGQPYALFDLAGRPVEPGATGPAIGVVAFADPQAMVLAGKRRRSWTDTNGVEKELLLLPPADAMQAIIERVQRSGINPLWIVLADLGDEALLELTNSHPNLRVIVAPPESGLIGLAAAPDAQYSGDGGQYAVIDREPVQLTKLVLRPEWIGETVITADVRMVPGSRWSLSEAVLASTTLRGYALEAEQLATGSVRYVAKPPTEGASTPLGDERIFAPAPEGSCDALTTVWTSDDGFLAMLADAAQRQLGADVVVLPRQDVELGFTGWLGEKPAVQLALWRSARALDELLYRAHDFTTVEVAADKLLETLKSATEVRGRGELELYGLTDLSGQPWHSTDLPPSKIAVNARPLVRGHYYRIALPVDIAERVKLSGRNTQNLFALMVARLHRRAGSKPNVRVDVRDCLTSEANARSRIYDNLDKLSLSAGQTKIAEGQFPVTFGALPVAAAGAKEQVNWSVALKLDNAFDKPRWALRAQVESDLKRTEQRGALRSNDRDESRVGGRADLKFLRTGLAIRLFVGGSLEGQLLERELETEPTRTEEVTIPSTGTPATVTIKGPKIRYAIERSHYRYGEIGFEGVTPVGLKFVDQLSFSARRQWGVVYLPVYVSLDDERLPDVFLTEKAIADALKARFQSGALLTSATDVHLHSEDRGQDRWQIDSAGAVKPRASFLADPLTIEWDYRFRRYRLSDRPAYSLSSTHQIVLKLKIPVWNRVTVGPQWDGTRITIGRLPGQTGTESGWVHQVSLAVEIPVFARLGPRPFIK